MDFRNPESALRKAKGGRCQIKYKVIWVSATQIPPCRMQKEEGERKKRKYKVILVSTTRSLPCGMRKVERIIWIGFPQLGVCLAKCGRQKGKFGRISGEELSLRRGNSDKITLQKGMIDKIK